MGDDVCVPAEKIAALREAVSNYRTAAVAGFQMGTIAEPMTEIELAAGALVDAVETERCQCVAGPDYDGPREECPIHGGPGPAPVPVTPARDDAENDKMIAGMAISNNDSALIGQTTGDGNPIEYETPAIDPVPRVEYLTDGERELLRPWAARTSGPGTLFEAVESVIAAHEAAPDELTALRRRLAAAEARAEKMETFEDALALPKLLAETVAERDALRERIRALAERKSYCEYVECDQFRAELRAALGDA